MKIFLLKQYYSIILLAAKQPTFWEKIQYFLKLCVAFLPVAAVLDYFNLWFKSNTLFFTGMLIALVNNMYFGYKYHRKFGDFKWRVFWGKNIEMWIIIMGVYPLLEILSRMAGENVVAEGFKIIVQYGTILYPGSKVVKNVHFLSDKRYPPEFLMKRFYTFEKTGDLKDLIENDKTE